MPIELFKFSITSMYHFYNKQKNQTLCFKKPDQQRPKVNMTSRLWTQGQGLWVSSLCLWSCPLHPLLRHAVMETFREARWSAGDVTLRGVASGGTCPFWMQLEGVCTVTWTKQFPRIWGGPSWSGEFSHLCEHWGDIFIVRPRLLPSPACWPWSPRSVSQAHRRDLKPRKVLFIGMSKKKRPNPGIEPRSPTVQVDSLPV